MGQPLTAERQPPPHSAQRSGGRASVAIQSARLLPPVHTASAQNRPGAAQQRQPPGCAPPGAANDASRAPPPIAGLVTARGADSPQFGQGSGMANSAIGRDSVNRPQRSQP